MKSLSESRIPIVDDAEANVELPDLVVSTS